jgi:hypothetical protein
MKLTIFATGLIVPGFQCSSVPEFQSSRVPEFQSLMQRGIEIVNHYKKN